MNLFARELEVRRMFSLLDYLHILPYAVSLVNMFFHYFFVFYPEKKKLQNIRKSNLYFIFSCGISYERSGQNHSIYPTTVPGSPVKADSTSTFSP